MPFLGFPVELRKIVYTTNAKLLKARLGHKSIVETLDTYPHLFPEHLHETAASAVCTGMP